MLTKCYCTVLNCGYRVQFQTGVHGLGQDCVNLPYVEMLGHFNMVNLVGWQAHLQAFCTALGGLQTTAEAGQPGLQGGMNRLTDSVTQQS